MARVFLATLGSDEKFVIGGLVRQRICGCDRVYVYVVEPVSSGVRAAYRSVEGFVRGYVGGVVGLVPVGLGSFEGAVERVARHVMGVVGRGDGVYAVLSGGMRGLVLAVYTALLLLGRWFRRLGVRVEGKVELEDRSGVLRLDGSLFSVFSCYSLVSEGDLRFLAEMGCGPVGLREVCERLGLQPSTVSKRFSRLERLGLVEVLSLKPRCVRVRPFARLLGLLRLDGFD